MVIKYISLVFSAIFEIYYADLFFKIFAKPKYKKSVHALVLTVILALQIVNSLFNAQLILFGFAIVITAALSVFYTGKPYINILLSLVLSVLNAISELITSGLVMLALGNEYTKVAENEFAYAVTVFTSKFLTLVIILIIRAFKTKFKNLALAKGNTVLLAFLPVTTVFLMLLMCKMIFAANNMQLNTMFVVASILLYFANIATIELLTRQADLTRNQIELSYLKDNMKHQISHYKDILSLQNETKKQRHDLKNFYTAILAMLSSGDVAEAESKISDELNLLSNKENTINTNHPAIDAVIQSKIDVCNENGITTDFKFRYNQSINVDEIELAVIIGNLLDNAIEACIKIDNDERWIKGIISAADDEITISILNSTNCESKDLKTNKPDKVNHGIGLKSVNELVNKYNGQSSYSFDSNEFKAFVVLRNN